MILGPPFESRECLPPTDSPLTEFNESEIFAGADYFSTAGTLAWAEIIGRLAARWPHLVGWNCDDMSDDVAGLPPALLAAATAKMRQWAPWLSFGPTIYYRPPGAAYNPDGSLVHSTLELCPDLALAIDAPVFFFRDEKQGRSLDSPCRQAGKPNASFRQSRVA